MWLLVLFIGVEVVTVAFGHGRLWDPPSRSSAWRNGKFNTPKNYNDNALFCGGFTRQQSAGGKCGICGDPYTGARDNEAGGKYATGTIVQKYKMNQVITTTAEITANHLGWIEYRICPNNNYTREVTQECLDQHVLQRADGRGTRVDILPEIIGYVKMDYQLPYGMACSQCVIQWKYHTGNSWGVDEATGRSCKGCGAQEEFYGCADVAIEGDSNLPLPELPIPLLPILIPETSNNCRALYNWAADPDLDKRCSEDCAAGSCDPHTCVCQ